MEKILTISLKLSFTQNALGCYGLISVVSLKFTHHVLVISCEIL